MSEAPLLVEREGAGVLLMLNRPEKRNALSIELRIMLAEALGAVGEDEEIAAIGVTGVGSAFCAGMDVSQFGGDEAHKRQLVESSTRCFRALTSCPKPTVALVNGAALGGGFALALCCDVRVASRAARFGFPELGRGIPPSVGAALSALPSGAAADLALSGRIIDASEARALGVVSRISEDHEPLSEIAGARAATTAEVKRRILLHREGASPAALLAEEESVMRAALLGVRATRRRRAKDGWRRAT